MFCPKCGKPDQTPESYCRQCGEYLPDFDKPARKKATPEEHLRVNWILSLLSAVTSLTLAITLYVIFLPKKDAPIVIYLTAGFLTALFAWQVQIIWRSLLLRKHFKKGGKSNDLNVDNRAELKEFQSFETKPLLNEAETRDFIDQNVIGKPTEKIIRQPKQNDL